MPFARSAQSAAMHVAGFYILICGFCLTTSFSDDAKPELETKPDDAESLPDLRLRDDEVTLDALNQLAGRHWDTVALSPAKFHAEMFTALNRAASIRTVRLSGPRVSGNIGRLKKVPGMSGLELYGPLEIRDLEAVGALTQLERLKLPQQMMLNVTGAKEIGKLHNLTSLRLYGVDIDDASFQELRTLIRLQELDLTHTRITDQGLTVLKDLPELKSLELYRHPAWHIKQQLTDACLPAIVQLKKLESLSISGEITDQGLEQIARLPALKRLSLLGTDIGPYGLAALADSKIECLAMRPHQVATIPVGGQELPLHRMKFLKSVLVNGQFGTLDYYETTKTYPGIGWTFIDP